ncbi:hypothetical protein Pfo_026441 [Paulownia fortunei]|nr:hypothetical protein Pfo_026441 [Paulownia fortunei]
MFFLLQEIPIQKSDQKGVEVSVAHDVDTSLRLSNSHDVHTSLRLSIGTPAAVSRITDEKRGKSPKKRIFAVKKAAEKIDTLSSPGVDIVVSKNTDYPLVHNPMPLRSFPPAIIPEIGFSLDGKRKSSKKRIFAMKKAAEKINSLSSPRVDFVVSRNSDYSLVHNPMPLRSFPPVIVLEIGFSLDCKSGCCFSQKRPYQESDDKGINISETNQVDTTLGLSPAKNASDEKKGVLVKRRRIKGDDDQQSEPISSLEEIPEILQTIESHNRTRPVFLYRKRLEQSDVRPDQNRLFVTGSEKPMEFLTKEEMSVVIDTNEGLDFFVIDKHVKFYKLHLGKWTSLKMVILNKEWKKLVLNNNIHKGDYVDLWGYRWNSQLCLSVNFRKS